MQNRVSIFNWTHREDGTRFHVNANVLFYFTHNRILSFNMGSRCEECLAKISQKYSETFSFDVIREYIRAGSWAPAAMTRRRSSSFWAFAACWRLATNRSMSSKQWFNSSYDTDQQPQIRHEIRQSLCCLRWILCKCVAYFNVMQYSGILPLLKTIKLSLLTHILKCNHKMAYRAQL